MDELTFLCTFYKVAVSLVKRHLLAPLPLSTRIKIFVSIMAITENPDYYK
jgi:hypothetical protein